MLKKITELGLKTQLAELSALGKIAKLIGIAVFILFTFIVIGILKLFL